MQHCTWVSLCLCSLLTLRASIEHGSVIAQGKRPLSGEIALKEALAVQGNVDPMVLFGDEECIRKEVGRVLAQAGSKHILGVGHGVIQVGAIHTVHSRLSEFRVKSPTFSSVSWREAVSFACVLASRQLLFPVNSPEIFVQDG